MTSHHVSNLITAVINGLCSSCIVVANWLVVFDIARIQRFSVNASERSLSVPGIFWTLPRSSDAALLCCFLSLGEYQPLCPAWLINLILREFLPLLRRFVFDTQRHKLRAMHYIVIASSLQGNNIDNSWASSQVVLNCNMDLRHPVKICRVHGLLKLNSFETSMPSCFFFALFWRSQLMFIFLWSFDVTSLR